MHLVCKESCSHSHTGPSTLGSLCQQLILTPQPGREIDRDRNGDRQTGRESETETVRDRDTQIKKTQRNKRDTNTETEAKRERERHVRQEVRDRESERAQPSRNICPG